MSEAMGRGYQCLQVGLLIDETVMNISTLYMQLILIHNKKATHLSLKALKFLNISEKCGF